MYSKSLGPRGRGPKVLGVLGPRPLGPWDLRYLGLKVWGPKVRGLKAQGLMALESFTAQVCSAVLLGTTPPRHLRLEDEGCDERKQLLVMLECFLRGLADVVLCRDLCATTRGTLAWRQLCATTALLLPSLKNW